MKCLIRSLMLFIVSTIGSLNATTVSVSSWRELIVKSDFVGVVECETAGGIVARYKVIESWKGESQGQTLTIRSRANFWGDQFPIALCGERYLLCASKNVNSKNIISSTFSESLPLWWRKFPVDYELPFYGGAIFLGAKKVKYFNSKYKTLNEFRIEALRFCKVSKDHQERVLLLLSYIGYAQQNKRELPIGEELSKFEYFDSEIKKSKTAEEFMAHLCGWAAVNPKSHEQLLSIVYRASSVKSLVFLKREKKTKFIKDAIEIVEKKINQQNKLKLLEKNSNNKDSIKWRDVSCLSELGSLFYKNDQFIELCKYKPEMVVSFLKTWETTRKEKEKEIVDQGYIIGSLFCHFSGGNRKKNFQELLKAHDPYIRVAAGAYLVYEDKELGIKELDVLQKIEGNAGRWASLCLARHGERRAFPRLWEALSTIPEMSMVGASLRNLQARILVLLSNSCKNSNIPMPLNSPDPSYGTFWNEKDKQKWLRKYQDRLILFDPWISELRKQRID